MPNLVPNHSLLLARQNCLPRCKWSPFTRASPFEQYSKPQGFHGVYHASSSLLLRSLLSFASLSLSPYSRLSVYTRTQMPRVDVGRVISPESKAPASGVGTLVGEFLNPFLYDSSLVWHGLRLCPDLACCRLRVVERFVVNDSRVHDGTHRAFVCCTV